MPHHASAGTRDTRPQRRRALTTLTTLGALALAPPGCTTPLNPDAGEEAALRVDRDRYVAARVGGEGRQLRYGFQVIARFENRSARTLYLARCYPDSPTPIYGVRLVDGTDRWGSAYDGAWACVGHDEQIEVRPGAARTDTLQLIGPGAFDGRTGEAFGTLVGRMRLVYEVQSCRGDGACRLDRRAGESGTFTVELSPQDGR